MAHRLLPTRYPMFHHGKAFAAVNVLIITMVILVHNQQWPPVPSALPRFNEDLFGDTLPEAATARLGTIRWRHSALIHFAAMLPGEKNVVSAGDDNTIRVWDFPSGKEVWRIRERFDDLGKSFVVIGGGYWWRGPRVAISPDGSTVATNVGGPIRLFQVTTRKSLGTLGNVLPNKNTAVAMAFAPDGRHLVPRQSLIDG
jgi:WD40 repeat protein